jgi:O-antigen/teichoic acid export membrane protein
MKKPTQQSSLLKAAVQITSFTYVTTALGLLVSVVVARALDPHDYGQFAYMVWLSGLLITIGNNGLGITGIRFISESLGRQDPATANRVHAWLRRGQQVSLVATTAIAFACLWLMPPAGWEQPMWILLGCLAVSVLGKGMFLFDASVAKGHNLYAIEAKVNMVMTCVYMLGSLLLAWAQASMVAFAAFFAVVSASHAWLARRQMRAAHIQPDPTLPAPELVTQIKQHLGWTIVLVVVGTLSNKTLETFLLSATATPADVGFFAIASALTKGAVELLSSAMMAMLMPMMARAYGEGGAPRVAPLFADAMRYTLFLGLMVAGVGSAFAALGISLMYGDKYTAAIPVLQVMLVVGGLTMVEGVYGALLSTTDHQKLRAVIAFSSVVISAVASFALVPAWGLAGAVGAHALTRGLLILVLGASVSRAMNMGLPWRDLSRQLGSALCAALLTLPLLLWHNGPGTQFAGGLVFALAFPICSMALGAWQAKDAQALHQLLSRRLPAHHPLLVRLHRWASTLR